jgi:hypothetical protein
MNITDAFAEYMEDNGFGTIGNDLYIGGIPLDTDNGWWILSGGGTSALKAVTNNKIKNYQINVFYRDTDSENVYNKLQEFEQFINSDPCPTIQGFDIIGIEVILFPTDQDLDNEDRTIGLAQVMITVYS